MLLALLLGGKIAQAQAAADRAGEVNLLIGTANGGNDWPARPFVPSEELV